MLLLIIINHQLIVMMLVVIKFMRLQFIFILAWHEFTHVDLLQTIHLLIRMVHLCVVLYEICVGVCYKPKNAQQYYESNFAKNSCSTFSSSKSTRGKRTPV